MNPTQSPGDPGSARQVGDLFQPVTNPGPTAAAITDQPVTLIDGLNSDGGPFCAPAPCAPAPQSGYASSVRRWAGRGAGLVVGTPAAVIALVASAVLVLVAAGMTMSTTSSTTSSPTESAVAGSAPSRLPAPAVPAVNDEHLVSVSPLDAPVGFARQAPAKAYSADTPPAPAHQQPLPAATRAVPARLAPPPAPDHRPPPPSSSPPSPVTTEDAGYRSIDTGSYAGKPESTTADTEACNCGVPKRQIHNDGDRPTEVDRQGDPRAQRAGYRSTSTAPESRVGEEGSQDRQVARPDAEAGSRPRGRPAAPAVDR